MYDDLNKFFWQCDDFKVMKKKKKMTKFKNRMDDLGWMT